MTKAKPLPAILPGPYGKKARVYAVTGIAIGPLYQVADLMTGWKGSLELTQAKAILAWNRVMSVYHAAKKGEKK